MSHIAYVTYRMSHTLCHMGYVIILGNLKLPILSNTASREQALCSHNNNINVGDNYLMLVTDFFILKVTNIMILPLTSKNSRHHTVTNITLPPT